MSGALKQPFLLEIAKFAGINTSENPEQQPVSVMNQLTNVSLTREDGSAAKVRGNARILTAAEGSGLSSVDFYKAVSLYGPQLRHVLITAGTEIKLVNSDGSTTAITGGGSRASGRPNIMKMFDRFGLIVNYNPFLIGDGNVPAKYDGDSVTNLGVYAPGSKETVIESFNDSSVFDNLTNITLADESDITWDGASTKCTGGTAAQGSSFYRTYSAFEINDVTTNRARFYVYIPAASYTKLNPDYSAEPVNSFAIAIRLSSSAGNLGATHYYEYWFRVGSLVTGWNTLICDLSSAPTTPTGTSSSPTTDLDTDNITHIRYKFTSKEAADQPVLYFDRLHHLDQGTPTVADGTTATVVEKFDTLADWKGSTDATIKRDTSIKNEGAASMEIEKSGATVEEVDIENDDALNMDLSDDVNDTPTIDIYVPTPGELESAGAIRVRLGTDDDMADGGTYDEWVFDRSDLSAGWNELDLDITAPDNQASGGAADYSAITGLLVRATYVDDSAYTEGVHVDNLKKVATGGVLSGNYSYKVTYVTKYGLESNAGPQSSTISFAAGSGGTVSLTDIPTSDDAQVVQRNLYRTAGGGTEWLYLAALYDNFTTTYTDTTADGSLAITTPPEAGDSTNDNSPPPDKMGMLAIWRRTVFGAGDPANPDYLYYSNDDEPEQWPLLNAYQLDSRITGMAKTYMGLAVTTENGFWRITGNNPNFVLTNVISGMGAVGPRTVGTSKNISTALDRDGLRLFDLRAVELISRPIEDKFEEMDKTNIEDSFVTHTTRHKALMQFNIGDDGSMDSLWMFGYEGDKMLETGKWTVISPAAGASLDFRDATEIETSDGEKKLYVAGNDGMLYELFSDSSNSWVDASGTTYPITTSLRTNWLRPGPAVGRAVSGDRDSDSESGRVRIMWAELRIAGDLSTGSEWTMTLESAMGSDATYTELTDSAYSETRTLTFGVNESMVRIGTQKFPEWDFIRVTVSNAQEGKDVYVRGILLCLNVESMLPVYPTR